MSPQMEQKTWKRSQNLFQFLEDRSLALVMREATDDGSKALQILCDHCAGKRKPRITTLHTELTSLRPTANGLRHHSGNHDKGSQKRRCDYQ